MRFMQSGQGYASCESQISNVVMSEAEKGHPHMDYLRKGCHQQ